MNSIIPTCYLCYVEGRDTPSKPHMSMESAQVEAERLACLKENLGNKVYILRTSPISRCSADVHWNIHLSEGDTL